MAEAAINDIALHFEETVLQPLHDSEAPEAKIVLMCKALADFYDRGKNNCFLGDMSLKEADRLFHEGVKRRLEIWIEAGIKPEIAWRRSQDTIAEIQGALILVRILNEPQIFLRTLNNLPHKLIQ